MFRFQKYLRVAVLSALTTYLLLLAVGVYCKPLYRHLFTEPLQLLEQERQYFEIARRPRFLWFHQPARDDKKGVVVLDRSKAWGDYTFFSSAGGPKAWLVDLNGNVVHEWTLDFHKIWADPRDRRVGVPWLHNFPDRVFLQPDGSVYALFCGEGGQIGDYGLAKVDKDSKVLWKLDQFANHDVSVMPDGRILTFVEELRFTPYPYAPSLKPPFVEPYLAILDPDGKEIKRLSMFDLFGASPLRKFLLEVGKDISPMNPRPANGDVFHPNTITRVTAGAVARNPALREGQYLLSFRNFDMLAAVDLEAGRITWASLGPWRGQHSPRFIADGSVVLFDNLGNLREQGGLSRVLNVDPATAKILWEYDGLQESPVYSSYNSMVDPLPNGNVLVTETEAGRIFEVTRDKEIVWDYRAPERIVIEGELRIPSLFSGRRFRREDLPFLGQEPAPAKAP